MKTLLQSITIAAFIFLITSNAKAQGICFLPQTTFSVGTSPVGTAVGDFNSDGKLDVIVANQAGNVSMLLGTGTGSFLPQTTSPAGTQPYGVAVGEFNGDGKLDAIVANVSFNSVTLLIGNGAGGFSSVNTFSVFGNARAAYL